MRLTHISIENYRCFERYQVDFRPGFNVLIGRNGVGKSLPTASDRNVVLRMRAADTEDSLEGRPAEYHSPEKLDSVYGMRLDANLEDIMDTPPADSEASTLARSYCLLKDAGADEAAEALLSDMSQRIGREQFLRLVEMNRKVAL